MRKPLKDKGYAIFSEKVGDEIFRIWFNRWTTKLSVCRAKHKSNRTHGGDAEQFCNALMANGYADVKKGIKPERVKIKETKSKKKKSQGAPEQQIVWSESEKKYTAHRINLIAFYEWAQVEKKIVFDEFDKYIISLIFESLLVRHRTVSLNKNYFESIMEIILEVLEIPLTGLKTYLFDYWSTDKQKVEDIYLSIKMERESMTLNKFKEKTSQVNAGLHILPGLSVAHNYEQKLLQLSCYFPNSFTEKILRVVLPAPLYKVWEKEYYERF